MKNFLSFLLTIFAVAVIIFLPSVVTPMISLSEHNICVDDEKTFFYENREKFNRLYAVDKGGNMVFYHIDDEFVENAVAEIKAVRPYDGYVFYLRKVTDDRSGRLLYYELLRMHTDDNSTEIMYKGNFGNMNITDDFDVDGSSVVVYCMTDMNIEGYRFDFSDAQVPEMIFTMELPENSNRLAGIVDGYPCLILSDGSIRYYGKDGTEEIEAEQGRAYNFVNCSNEGILAYSDDDKTAVVISGGKRRSISVDISEPVVACTLDSDGMCFVQAERYKEENSGYSFVHIGYNGTRTQWTGVRSSVIDGLVMAFDISPVVSFCVLFLIIIFTATLYRLLRSRKVGYGLFAAGTIMAEAVSISYALMERRKQESVNSSSGVFVRDESKAINRAESIFNRKAVFRTEEE